MFRERELGKREKERAGNGGCSGSCSGRICGNGGSGMEMAEMGGVTKNVRRRR